MKKLNGFVLLVLIFAVCLLVVSCGSDSDDDSGVVDGDADSLEDGDTDSEGVDGDGEEVNEEPEPLSLVVMSYNVLCWFCDSSYDPWEDRLAYFKDIFTRHDPDIIGTQELFNTKDTEELLGQLPGYEVLYLIDPDSPEILKEYPDAAIFYKSERFEVVENGFYWLSETPDEPWSGGWNEGGGFWRLVAWAHFRQISDGREFYFASTHFDNNTPNQEKSAPLFLDRISQFTPEIPAIVLGDFNSRPDSIAYDILDNGVDGEGFNLTNLFDIADEWSIDSNQNSVQDFDTENRIDHIWVGGDYEYSSDWWKVDMWLYGDSQLMPSDHYPIVAEVSVK